MGGLMAAGYIIGAGNTIFGAYAQSVALRAQGEYQKSMAKINARLAGIKAEDALNQGEEAAAKIRSDAKKVVGSQRAALAAQGLDVDAGTASDLQRDTEESAARDIMTVRNNAWRQAWGFRTQATFDQQAANFQAAANNNLANSTLITGGTSALSQGLKGAYYSKGSGTRSGKIEGYSGTRDFYATNEEF